MRAWILTRTRFGHLVVFEGRGDRVCGSVASDDPARSTARCFVLVVGEGDTNADDVAAGRCDLVPDRVRGLADGPFVAVLDVLATFLEEDGFHLAVDDIIAHCGKTGTFHTARCAGKGHRESDGEEEDASDQNLCIALGLDALDKVGDL